MLPGKTYKPEDFLWIAWKRKWFIAIPAVTISLGMFLYAYSLPNVFQSDTTILIVPQAVPADYVRSTITQRLDERLNMISQQLLSRTRLERLIQEFNLYTRERKTMLMEDVVEKMRKSIKVEPVGGKNNPDTNAFKLRFESDEQRNTMLVTQQLAQGFIKENIEVRATLADQTNIFLETQLEHARSQLIAKEKELEEYRRRNAGQLPTQVNSNLQMMQSTNFQLQTLIDSMQRDRERMNTLDGDIAATLAQIANALTAPAPGTAPAGAPAGAANGGAAAGSTSGSAEAGAARSSLPAPPLSPLAVQIEQAQAALRIMKEVRKLGANHPEVAVQEAFIKELVAKLPTDGAPVLPGSGAPVPNSPVRVAQDRVAQMRKEFDDLQKRLDVKKTEETRLQANIDEFKRRLEAAPGRESEMVELMRDYGTLQQSYNEMLRKSLESQIAVNLERRQIGEQFRILDGARFPEKPISPDRIRMNLMGAVAGLALGFGLVALLEYRDTSLKTHEDVVTSLALPVLAVIPVMVTQADLRLSTRRRRLLAGLAGGVLVIAVVAVTLWKPDLISRWWN